MNSSVNVLGTEYSIIRKKYDEDKAFSEGLSGYACLHAPVICVGDLETFPEMEDCDFVEIELMEKAVLRHEIVHAFLNESGLSYSSASCNAWAANEEMVDWIAKQGLKIHKAWEEAGAI